ncbi:hypothetical protein ACVW0L_002661, partial [Thermostichus sp. OS-CIW-17]
RLRGIEPLRLTAYPPARQAALWREYPGGSDGQPPKVSGSLGDP